MPKYNQTEAEAETEAKTMTESDLQHAIDCAHDCNVGYQAAPYEAELTRRERQAKQDNEIANACVSALGDRGAQPEDIFANSANLFGGK